MKGGKWWKVLKAAIGMSTFFIAISGTWTIVYFTIGYVYDFFAWQPSVYLFQLLNVLLGLLLFYGIVNIIFLFVKTKQNEISRSLTDAMRRIAKGDFKVRLEIGHQDRGPFGGIVHEINDMVVELDEMEQLRQSFISDVSHEIQSPLTSISGFARALQNDHLGAEQRREYLRIIESESERLSKLSDNLLKLASLESDRHPFEPKRYRLDRQLGRLILACEPQWHAKGITMNVELGEAYVNADEDLLSQVWVNLISNSIKFTPTGGTIDIGLEGDEQGVLFRIRNTGMGIAPEDQLLIFQRFYKVDQARNHKAGGSGLGLSIVKMIVDMHQGTIAVNSELGEGAEFTVHLPPLK